MAEPLAAELEGIATRAKDSESCGLLIGNADPPTVTVTGVRQIANMYGLRNRFGIGQDDYRAALQACKSGEQIVGVVHVHFGSPELSVVDMHQAVAHGLIWLVIDASAEAGTWAANCRCVNYQHSETIDMDLLIDR